MYILENEIKQELLKAVAKEICSEVEDISYLWDNSDEEKVIAFIVEEYAKEPYSEDDDELSDLQLDFMSVNDSVYRMAKWIGDYFIEEIIIDVNKM